MKQILEKIESRGYRLIGAVQFPHPKDDYLWYVLVDKGNEHVMWTFNSQDGGFFHGHYFDSKESAYSYFAARLMHACDRVAV